MEPSLSPFLPMFSVVRITTTGVFSFAFTIPIPPIKEKYISVVPGRIAIPTMITTESYTPKHAKSEVRLFFKSNFRIHLLNPSVTASVSLESAAILSVVLNFEEGKAPFLWPDTVGFPANIVVVFVSLEISTRQ